MKQISIKAEALDKNLQQLKGQAEKEEERLKIENELKEIEKYRKYKDISDLKGMMEPVYLQQTHFCSRGKLDLIGHDLTSESIEDAF